MPIDNIPSETMPTETINTATAAADIKNTETTPADTHHAIAPPSESTHDFERMREVAMTALDDAKGENIIALEVRALTDITDCMLIATATSDRHVKALADSVIEKMRHAGWQKLGVEGIEARDWVLVDFVDLVVHIMRAQTRAHYDLEGLWDVNLSALLKPKSDNKINAETRDY